MPAVILTFDAISSPNATRDYAVDLSGKLETGETVSSVTVTSSNTGLLTISNTTSSSQTVTFTVTTATAAEATVKIYVAYVGDAGTADRIEIKQPIVNYLNT